MSDQDRLSAAIQGCDDMLERLAKVQHGESTGERGAREQQAIDRDISDCIVGGRYLHEPAVDDHAAAHPDHDIIGGLCVSCGWDAEDEHGR